MIVYLEKWSNAITGLPDHTIVFEQTKELDSDLNVNTFPRWDTYQRNTDVRTWQRSRENQHK